MVKAYLISIIIFFMFWFFASILHADPVWWSIFPSDRSTHTPWIEQISIVKVTFAAMIAWGMWALLKSRKSK
jgi:hypothetical protein